jgi:hypothetical protein
MIQLCTLIATIIISQSRQSLEILKAKQLLQLLVVRVLVSKPGGMVLGDSEPQPVGQKGVESSTGMEPVTSLDQLLGLDVLQVGSLEDVFSWEIVVVVVEVFELMRLIDDLPVYSRELFGPASSVFADGVVGVEPASTGADSEAVQKIINRVIGHI